MWPVLTRTLRARPLRALLTALAVALGVAAVLGVQVTLGALDGQAAAVAALRAGRSDIDVRSVAGVGLDAGELAALRRVPGVAEVRPLYEKRVAAATAADQLDAIDVTLVGVAGGEAALRPVTLTAGRLPSEVSVRLEVALDGADLDALAARSGHRPAIGDTVFLTTSTGPAAFMLTGVTAGTSGGAALTRSAAFVPVAEATGPFALGLHVPLAALRLTPGADPAGVAARVREGLGPVVTTADPRAAIDEPLDQLRPLLALLVVLSVILGAGVSANSLAMSTAERRRDTGLLRAAGASRRQVLALFLGETALIAAAGGVAGLFAGVGLATVLAHLAVPPGLPVPSLSPTASQVGTALAAGLAAAFAGALLPAVAATRVSALAALRARPAGERERPPLRAAGAALGLAGGAAVLLRSGPEAAVAAGVAVGLLALAVAVALVAPGLLKALGTLLSPLLPRAPVAAANLARRRNRSGLVLGVLTVSVASAVALASLTSAAMAAGNDWVAHLFAADTVLVSPVTANDAVAAEISSSARVTVGRLRFLSAPVDGVLTGITAADLQPYLDHGGLDMVEGDRLAALHLAARQAAVIVPAQLAETYGWRVGDVLDLDPGSGSGLVAVTVAGVAAHTFPGGDGRESLLMGRDLAVGILGPAAAGFDDLQVVGSLPSGGDLQALAASFGMQVTRVADIQAAAANSLERSLALLGALGWLGLIVAMLAVVNTLVMNARQGARDVALLRAVGLSRRHSLRLILVEAGVLVLAGSLVGTAAGLAMTVPVLRVSASTGFSPAFTVPLAGIAAAILVVSAGGVLAAYVPARRAAATSIVGAIRYQ